MLSKQQLYLISGFILILIVSLIIAPESEGFRSTRSKIKLWFNRTFTGKTGKVGTTCPKSKPYFYVDPSGNSHCAASCPPAQNGKCKKMKGKY